MADATALLRVSEALQSVLRTQLSVLAIPPANVRIESIDLIPDPVPPPRVTIFLFNIQENPYLKNADASVATAGPGDAEARPPPAVLDLDYMICAWMSTTTEEHLVLGDVVRVLHDGAEFSPSMLGAGFGPDESVQLTLANFSIEDQTRIWTTFGFKRFKLALYYKARVVPIRSTRTFRDRIVRERTAEPETFVPPPAGHVSQGAP